VLQGNNMIVIPSAAKDLSPFRAQRIDFAHHHVRILPVQRVL